MVFQSELCFRDYPAYAIGSSAITVKHGDGVQSQRRLLCAAENPTIALCLQSKSLAVRFAELVSLGS